MQHMNKKSILFFISILFNLVLIVILTYKNNALKELEGKNLEKGERLENVFFCELPEIEYKESLKGNSENYQVTVSNINTAPEEVNLKKVENRGDIMYEGALNISYQPVFNYEDGSKFRFGLMSKKVNFMIKIPE